MRIEILLTKDVFGPSEAQLLQEARTHRNNLAHRSKIDPGGVDAVLNAMTSLIQRVTQLSVVGPYMGSAIAW